MIGHDQLIIVFTALITSILWFVAIGFVYAHNRNKVLDRFNHFTGVWPGYHMGKSYGHIYDLIKTNLTLKVLFYYTDYKKHYVGGSASSHFGYIIFVTVNREPRVWAYTVQGQLLIAANTRRQFVKKCKALDLFMFMPNETVFEKPKKK